MWDVPNKTSLINLFSSVHTVAVPIHRSECIYVLTEGCTGAHSFSLVKSSSLHDLGENKVRGRHLCWKRLMGFIV